MKILFDHSSPFALAHGGFQIQIEQTKAALERLGVEVEYLRWWDASQTGDIIHFFGRPPLGNILQAQSKGIAYVFSELLTSQGSRSNARITLQSWASQLSRKFFPLPWRALVGWESYRQTNAVIALTPWEAELMVKLYGARPESVHIIGNGVEDIFFTAPVPPEEKGDHLVCTATITERKRVIELAEAAILAKVPLRIIGRPYTETDPYYLRFLDTVKRGRGLIRYDGGIEDRQVLATAYRQAKGFILLSGMESQSLSALEAAASKLPLLLSDLPWARQTFGNKAKYCSASATSDETAERLRHFFATPSLANFQVQSWGDIAAALNKVYHSLAQRKSQVSRI